MGKRGPKPQPRIESVIRFRPEHYEWLKAQPKPMSKVLESLIDEAMRRENNEDGSAKV